MANTRHIYWWPIIRYTSGSGENNKCRVYDGSSYHVLTIDSDTSDSTQWSSIYGLASKLEDAIQAVGGAWATATVSVDLDTGLLTMTGGSGLIGPAPSTYAQKRFDTLIGGNNTAGTPASSWTFPSQHAYGLYLTGKCTSDYGNVAKSITDAASRLDGSTSVHYWGSSTNRSIRYEFLTASEYSLYTSMLQAPQEVVFISDPVEAWGTTIAANYCILTDTPSTERVSPGLDMYHVEIELGVL